jgi:serine phosphatase RsbU (regulator of sigma subunit)
MCSSGLFPQKLPHVKGLDFAGYCRPAQGVGGDYYDFIHLANGSLGIAVGDVSGKGHRGGAHDGQFAGFAARPDD